MKTLEVTDEQYAFVQRLREEIGEQVVGQYGFVRERDAIQFLIDNLDGSVEFDGEFEIEQVENENDDRTTIAYDDPTETTVDEDSAIGDETSSGAEIDTEDGGSTDGESGETAAVEETDDAGDVDATDETDDAADSDEIGDDDVDGGEGETVDADEPADGDGPVDDDEIDTDEDSSADDDETDEDGSADDDDMLDRMMSLLETHDDKWEESPAADYRYRVELPDGTTEDVQTKDDVRALLFQNYR